MTYTAGSTIVAADYNGFVANNAGANINDIWGAGTGDKGWGQTTLGTVSAAGLVTATQWASLVNTLSAMGAQTNTTLTSRTAPTAGQTISILSNLNTDLTNVTNNRGNAAAVGSQYTTGGSAAATGETSRFGWTLTFTHSMTFASAAAARYFFNAGGIVQMAYTKTSTGLTNDAEWNAFVAQIGTLNLTGRVNNAAQTIAGTSYTGTRLLGNTGGTVVTLPTTTGFYQLTPGAAAVTLLQINNGSAPYTSEYIATTCALNAGSTVLSFVTTWYQPQGSGTNTSISAGATTALSYFPPSTSYLTNTWGTPTLSASESQYP